jgi:hypothetical protein
VLTGSHHPPALWKARNDYYSSSQPFKIIGQFRKISRIKSSCFILGHQISNGKTAAFQPLPDPAQKDTVQKDACFGTGNNLSLIRIHTNRQ